MMKVVKITITKLNTLKPCYAIKIIGEPESLEASFYSEVEPIVEKHIK